MAISLRRGIAGVLLFLAGGLIAGCGSETPFSYVPVQGQVRYEDGSAIPTDGFLLQFIAIDTEAVGDAHPRPATAVVGQGGAFDAVTSYKFGDGLTRGRHKVAIVDAKDGSGNQLVPVDYTSISTTPLTIDTADTPLEIVVPTP